MSIGELFGFLVASSTIILVCVWLPFAIFSDREYGDKFRKECVSKGGVVVKPYKSKRMCMPKDVIIPVEVK